MMDKAIKKETKYLYFREGAIQSIISDIFMFGSIIAGLWFNHNHLGSKWYVDLVFIFMVVIVLTNRATGKTKVFTSLTELKKYVAGLKE